MRFTIPEDTSLNRDVIRNEFMEVYYPEMKKQDYSFFSIFDAPNWVRLEKNMAVAAHFNVEQDPKNKATHITLYEGPNKKGRFLLGDLWGKFSCGDFYDNVYENFYSWLKKKYNLANEDIQLHRKSFVVSLLKLLFAIVILLILFPFDYDDPSVLFFLAVAIAAGIFFDWWNIKKRDDKIEKLTGTKVKTVSNSILKTIIKVIVAAVIFLALWFAVYFVLNMISSTRTSLTFDQKTETYASMAYSAAGDIDYDNINNVEDNEDVMAMSEMSDDSEIDVSNFYKHLPTKKIIKISQVLEEYNGYALGVKDGKLVIGNPKGELTTIEATIDPDYPYASFLTPDIIMVEGSDYTHHYFGLDGKPVNNLTTWTMEYKDNIYLITIITAVLWALGLWFFWRRKNRKRASKV